MKHAGRRARQSSLAAPSPRQQAAGMGRSREQQSQTHPDPLHPPFVHNRPSPSRTGVQPGQTHSGQNRSRLRGVPLKTDPRLEAGRQPRAKGRFAVPLRRQHEEAAGLPAPIAAPRREVSAAAPRRGETVAAAPGTMNCCLAGAAVTAARVVPKQPAPRHPVPLPASPPAPSLHFG